MPPAALARVEEMARLLIDHHLRLFGRPPNQASADRGLYSAANEAYATQQGVKRVILPRPASPDGPAGA